MAGPVSHHTAFLLAILIGILLLLLVACVLLICYCRDKCSKSGRHGHKTRRIDGRTREQTTSMTCVNLNYSGPPALSFHGLQNDQDVSCRLTERCIQFSPYEDQENSCITVENWATGHSQPGTCAHPEAVNTELHLMERQEWEISVHGSTSYCMFSSCPSLMENALRNVKPPEHSPVERLLSRRCSFSLNSNMCSDLMFDLQESTIPDGSFLTDHLGTTQQQEHCSARSKATTCPEFVWCSSTTVSRNSLLVLGQQNGLIDLQNHSRHSESLSVPNTLKRSSLASANLEGSGYSGQSLAQLPKPQGLRPPKSWFIFLGNTSITDRTVISKNDTNNVASVDSGVDILELQTRRVCTPEDDAQKSPGQRELFKLLGTPETEAKCDCVIEQLHSSGPRGKMHTEEMEDDKQVCEQPIVHAKVAVNLNQVNSGNKRSLWQKMEERPLIGIN